MNLKRLANLFAIALISAATLTACGEDDVIDNDDQTIVDDTSEPDKDDDDNQGTGEDTDSNEELKVALLTDYVKDSDTFFLLKRCCDKRVARRRNRRVLPLHRLLEL